MELPKENLRDLRQVTAIVTGAAGGIGREIVGSLLASGARVLAVDSNRTQVEVLEKEWIAAGRQLCCFSVDLTEPGSPRAIVGRALKAFGAFNALISNAGVGRSLYTKDVLGQAPRTWQVPESAWAAMFNINALSAIRLVNAAVPVLLNQQRGRIVAVTTSLDSMINAGTGPYGPSKAALEAFVAVVADELAGTSVTANVLVPGGVVDTAMIPQTEGIDRNDLLKPSVMVSPLQFLLSDQADAVTAMRFRANLWDASLMAHEAMSLAGAPIAWSSIAAGQRRDPSRKI